MPQLSTRAKEIPASPIRKLVPYADAAKNRGTHVFHLNIGQPDIKTPPSFFEAIEQANPEVLAYTHSEGILSLREKIAAYYSRLGYPVNDQQVLVTTGASEALSFVFSTCFNPGDELIVPEPFYANYNGFSVFSDINIVPIQTDIENNFSLPPMEAFEALITERTKGILICNPGNPTGVMYPKEALEKLGKIVKKHNLYLIADEVYREFAYDNLKHHSILGLPDLEENAIVTDSVSKRFSACGARIGCIVSRNKSFRDAALKFCQARLCSPAMGQIGAAAMYDLPASFYEEVVVEYVARRNTLLEHLRKIEGVYVPEVNGAFYAMVRLPIDDSEKFCQWMLEEFSHDGATVMMAPGSGFYSTPGRGKDEVRMAYVLQESDLVKAVTALQKALEVYPGRTN
ncbi:MAG: pyridoxal phosphate-dependent aminotransferase [Bacteroidota bacterium]